MGIYFDNATTSYPKPDCVLSAMGNYFKNIGANSGRSARRLTQEASRMVFETRENIAKLIGAKDSSRIVFTMNATEGLNLAILGSLEKGDRVITTSMEHNSVMRHEAFAVCRRRKRSESRYCKMFRKGCADIKKKIKKTRLIITTSTSNVVRTIMPIQEIGKIAKEHNVLFLVDAAQTMGILPMDVEKNNTNWV